MAKKRDSLIMFTVLWLFTVVFYMLQATGNIGDFIQAVFYIIITASSLGVLAVMKSDEEYYANLNVKFLGVAVIVALVMTLLSWGLSLCFGPNVLALSYTLSFIAAPSSVSTIFLSLALFGLVMAATSEELLKLVGFAELKSRYGKKWYGVLYYAGFPVGFWALLHGIQAYQNPILILPALTNGVVLIIFLWRSKCIFGVIISHWLYNIGITAVSFATGKGPITTQTPFLPNFSSLTIADGIVLLLFIAWILFFAVPAIKNKN